jgi:hypothetical protein
MLLSGTRFAAVGSLSRTVGLAFLTARKNADGSPRHTYVKAGENIVSDLARVAGRFGQRRARAIAIADPVFDAAVERIQASGVNAAPSNFMARARLLSKRFSSSISTIIILNSACAENRWPLKTASAM